MYARPIFGPPQPGLLAESQYLSLVRLGKNAQECFEGVFGGAIIEKRDMNSVFACLVAVCRSGSVKLLLAAREGLNHAFEGCI